MENTVVTCDVQINSNSKDRLTAYAKAFAGFVAKASAEAKKGEAK